MQKTISLSSMYNFVSGYKNILKTLLYNLPNENIEVIPRSYSQIHSEFLPTFNIVKSISDIKLDLSLFPMMNTLGSNNPLTFISNNKTRLLYTMWESTRVNDIIIELLNDKFKCVIVPNHYNKENFIKQGLTTNIEVVPLFCNFPKNITKISHANYVFGISNEDPRKNLDKITKCFIKAFRNIKDVELHVKTCKTIQRISDPRIKYITSYLDESCLDTYYNSLDLYICGSTCEGWGMMVQEAMLHNIPLIFNCYGGVKEFVTKDCGIEIGYDEVYSTGPWGEYGGKWSEFKENDMIEAMIYCYKNKDELKSKGLLAKNIAEQYTKERFIKSIGNIITKYYNKT